MNIGNPQEVSIAELAALVLELTGAPGPVVHVPRPEDDPTVRRPDIALARRGSAGPRGSTSTTGSAARSTGSAALPDLAAFPGSVAGVTGQETAANWAS